MTTPLRKLISPQIHPEHFEWKITIPYVILKYLFGSNQPKLDLQVLNATVKQLCNNTVAQKAQTQINFPKHVTVSQNTSQFPKAHNSFPKYKLISQNTNMFSKTQINFPKHKSISISKDWALHYYERDGLERRVTNSGPGSFASNMATKCHSCNFVSC